jgi:hypothetical protein
MSIFKEIHELRTVASPDDNRELPRKLAIAISHGWVEQIPVDETASHGTEKLGIGIRKRGRFIRFIHLMNAPACGWRLI